MDELRNNQTTSFGMIEAYAVNLDRICRVNEGKMEQPFTLRLLQMQKSHPIQGGFVLFGEILIKKGDLIHYPLLLD